ncbi:MAG: ATP-binding protein [Elusimicrobiota bacterium]
MTHKYKPRDIAKVLAGALDNMPVVVLTGLRQTGKSTFLLHQNELKSRKYYSFDDLNVLDAARRNPEEFLSSPQPLTIDEAQKFPELLTYIKQKVDKNRKPGQFLLSGSSNFALLKNIAESLAGRAVYLTMYPFSHREICGNVNAPPVLAQFLDTGNFPKKDVTTITWRDVITGGMPTVCLGGVKNPDVWFKGYEQTYVERDIRSLSQVADLSAFRNLLRLAAFRNTQILNQSELARDAKLNVMTTIRYVSLLETSYLIQRIPPYLRNPATRLIKSPKIYITDSGLASYLTGMRGIESSRPFSGALWESYTAQNLASIISSNLPNAEIAYWNIQGRYEVDFIIETGGRTIAIEVKSGSRWRTEDLTGLKAYMNNSQNCTAALLVYNGKEVLKLENKIWAVPISLLLS